MENINLNTRTSLKWIVSFAAEILLLYVCVKYQNYNGLTQIWFTNIFYIIIYCNYIWLIWYSIRNVDCKNHIILTMLIMAGFVGMGIAVFIGTEETIKQYDATVYWIKAIEMNRGMYTNSLETLKLIRETLSAEYGNFPAFLLAPFFHYFGESNIVFCCTVYLIYGVPSVLLLSVYGVRIVRKFKNEINQKLECVVVSVCALTPAMLFPILLNYLDIIGIVWIGILLNLTLDWKMEKITVKRDGILALISVALLFSRRWYAFYIVGFYFAFGIESLVALIVEKMNWKEIVRLILNLLIIAGGSSIMILFLNKDTFSAFFGGGYGNAYAAYKTRSTLMDFVEAFQNIGYLFMVIGLFGIIMLLTKRETYRYGIRLIVSSLVAVVLFGTIQSMGSHHMYILIPNLVICISIGMYLIISYFNSKWQKCAIPIAGIVLGINMVNCFLPTIELPAKNILSKIRCYPAVMDNAGRIKEATEYLVTSDKSVYINGEGSDFSSELFNRCLLPNRITALDNMIAASIVDLRDGFPSQAFMSDYIVVRNPYKTGFSETQLVSYAIWEMLLENEESKKYYELDEEILLNDDGSTIQIYKKINQLNPEIIRWVSERIARKYGEEESFAYEPNWFNALLWSESEIKLNYYSWDQSMEIKSNEKQVELSFNVNNEFEVITFSLSGLREGDKMSIYGDSELLKEYVMNSGEKVECETSISQYDEVVIRIEKSGDEDDERTYYIYNQNVRLKK